MAVLQQDEKDLVSSAVEQHPHVEPAETRGRRVWLFGDFQLDGQECRLWCRDSPVAIAPKTFDLLVVLVENAGQLVEKEKLLRAVWRDTFVEESNLSVYVSALRKIFGEHQYIETVPKRGYRFCAPVTLRAAVSSGLDDLKTTVDTAGSVAHDLPHPAGSQPAKAAVKLHVSLPWILLVLFCIATTFFLARRDRAAAPAAGVLNSRPLASLPGQFFRPSFSADGQRLAYSWRSPKDNFRSVYVQDVRSDERTRLTLDSDDNVAPAWSPAGEEIAYLRSRAGVDGIDVVIANPDMPSQRRTLATLNGGMNAFRRAPTLSWSPDHRWLLTTESLPDVKQAPLVLISVTDGLKHDLTHVKQNTVDDEGVFSPDGRLIAFRRSLGSSADALMVVPVGGGAERRLTVETLSIDGIAWSTDGKDVIFSSGRATSVGNLFRMPLAGGEPTPLTTSSMHAFDPAVSANGHRLAYISLLRNVTTWRLPTDGSGQPEQLIASNFLDSAADYSPDGKHIAFRSDRSGSNEVWICDSDGKQPRRLTNVAGEMTGSPAWSPDGRWLAFDSRVGGHSAIFIANALGGRPIKVTNSSFEDADNVVPSWSRDGRAIYFSSNRTGAWQIWRRSINGDAENQVTAHGGFRGLSSTDGKDLYFVKDLKRSSVWRLSLTTGEETEILDGLGPGMWGYWSLSATSSRIFFIENKAGTSESAEVYEMDLNSKTRKQIGQTQSGLNVSDKGLDTSPDGRWLLYSQRDIDRSNIMVVDSWR